jgi:hypothetical protein
VRKAVTRPGEFGAVVVPGLYRGLTQGGFSGAGRGWNSLLFCVPDEEDQARRHRRQQTRWRAAVDRELAGRPVGS